MIRDPDLIKQITVKDFDYFMDHRTIVPEESDPLWGKNLFALNGKRWRDMRSNLSPSFTSSKMRYIFSLIDESTTNLVNYYKNKNQDSIEIEMKDTFTRFANDVIASTAFGINTDSLNEPNNEFFLMGKEATNFASILKSIKFILITLSPNIFKWLNITLLGGAVNRFFIRVIKESIKVREEKSVVRPDMINCLLETRKQIANDLNATKDVITDTDVAAQALIFFFAGFDTVSSLMSFASHEIAINPDIQTRLRAEINQTLKDTNGKLTYEALLQMKYMDMVISEALRKWPTGVVGDRICTKPYTIKADPQRPHEKPIHLNVGDPVWIPVYGLHRDPKYYPDPDKFDPERFSDENKANIQPYTYLPFGTGPRNCIGSRFALMETKAVLFRLLEHFELVPTAKTQISVQLSTKTFSMNVDHGFWFALKPIKQ